MTRTGILAATAAMAFFLTFPLPLLAANSGDMFGAAGAGPYSRPSVPSDAYVGPDMFPPAPVFMDPNAELVGRKRPPYDFGTQDMFVTHPEPVPPYPLFDYPKR